jgi:hypothetical protein
VQCPANRFCLSDLDLQGIDLGSESFVDVLISGICHITVGSYSKPPEEAVRVYLGIFL